MKKYECVMYPTSRSSPPPQQPGGEKCKDRHMIPASDSKPGSETSQDVVGAPLTQDDNILEWEETHATA